MWSIDEIARTGLVASGAVPEPIVFATPFDANTFGILLHHFIPVLDVEGDFMAFYEGSQQEGEGFTVRLKKPLPDDLIDAFKTIVQHTRKPHRG